MNTFKLNTKYAKDKECYIENIGTEEVPEYCAKNVQTGEPEIVLNIRGTKVDGAIVVKDYSENEGLLNCLINEGLIEKDPVDTVAVNIVTGEVHKVTQKFLDCLKA